MASVTLSKALKMKNRLAQQIGDLQSQVASQNSYLVESKPDYDVPAVYEELKRQKNRLIALKTAITNANRPVQDSIYRLAELKGLVAFLKAMDTKRGAQFAGFGMGNFPSYESQISATERDAEVARLEREIDDLQDRLDAHNATVRIDVEVEEA
jgi:hypothetical protein